MLAGTLYHGSASVPHLFHSITVDLMEKSDHQGLLANAWRAVKEDVWTVASSHLSHISMVIHEASANLFSSFPLLSLHCMKVAASSYPVLTMSHKIGSPAVSNVPQCAC